MTAHTAPRRYGGHLRTGDTVKVLAGIDRGKKGKILQMFRDEQRAVVEGVNRRSKNLRARRQNDKGEIVHFDAPVALSNLLLVCPQCHKPTRVSMKRTEEGKRLRSCKQCQNPIDK